MIHDTFVPYGHSGVHVLCCHFKVQQSQIKPTYTTCCFQSIFPTNYTEKKNSQIFTFDSMSIVGLYQNEFNLRKQNKTVTAFPQNRDVMKKTNLWQ